MEDVGRKQATLKFYFSFSTSVWCLGFAYIYQSTWVGIIAIKNERTQFHFLSDVLIAVASLDLKVPIVFRGGENLFACGGSLFFLSDQLQINSKNTGEPLETSSVTRSRIS